MAEIIELANKNRVYFFEAARNIHEQSFQKIAELLPLKNQILGANFTYMKYSSRYDQVLEGKEPNIFSPHFSGGLSGFRRLFSLCSLRLVWRTKRKPLFC